MMIRGSLASADREGVRDAPTNAAQALVDACTGPPEGVTRELLLAFAEHLLGTRRARRPPQGTSR